MMSMSAGTLSRFLTCTTSPTVMSTQAAGLSSPELLSSMMVGILFAMWSAFRRCASSKSFIVDMRKKTSITTGSVVGKLFVFVVAGCI